MRSHKKNGTLESLRTLGVFGDVCGSDEWDLRLIVRHRGFVRFSTILVSSTTGLDSGQSAFFAQWTILRSIHIKDKILQGKEWQR